MRKTYSMKREVNPYDLTIVEYIEEKTWRTENALWVKEIKKTYSEGKLLMRVYRTAKLNRKTFQWEKLDDKLEIEFF